MSEEAKKEEVTESADSPKNLVDSVKSFLEDLVPPPTVVISDVFGNKYNLLCSVSARKQITILREFDKIEEVKNAEIKEEDNIVQTIIKIASNEDYLAILCRCFKLAHNKCLMKAKEEADKQNYEYEDGELLAADLFSLEELATAIIPLFIRLAQRTSQALNQIMNK